jgi:AmmeMemoRadiSam system protein B
VRRLAAISIGIVLLSACGRGQDAVTIDVPVGDAEREAIFRGIHESDALAPTGVTPDVPVVVVPHHLTAAITIARGIEILAAKHPTSILLVSPDHFGGCPSLLCTANARFSYGENKTEVDPAVLQELIRSPLVTDNAKMFQREHGIYSLIPFILRLLPRTTVTPLAVAIRPDWKAHQEELLSLLLRATKANVTVVISSDFSHYLPIADANQEDEATAETIAAKDFAGIANLKNPSQSDCPACLWLGARVADTRNAYNPSFLLHTNSARLLQDLHVPSTTSHFAIAFFRNATLSNNDLAVAGDVTVTRATTGTTLLPPASLREFWAGSGSRVVNLEGPLGETCTPDPNPYIFCNRLTLWQKIRSLATDWVIENNHMFDQGKQGPDVTGKLLERESERVITVSGSMIGGLRVFALTNLMNPVPDANAIGLSAQYREVIKMLKEGDKTIPSIVFVHEGTEFRSLLSEEEETYLRSFVDAGARAVIAVHSHIPGDIEFYRGAPIFRGLGNFVFDQHDRITTATAKVVRLRWTGGRIEFETKVGL